MANGVAYRTGKPNDGPPKYSARSWFAETPGKARRMSLAELVSNYAQGLLDKRDAQIALLREALIEMSANYILKCRKFGDLPDPEIIARQRRALDSTE